MVIDNGYVDLWCSSCKYASQSLNYGSGIGIINFT